MSSIPASFSALDWFLLLILAISTLAALRRGIIRVLFSLAGLVLGILLASWNYLSLALKLQPTLAFIGIASLPGSANFALAQSLAFLAILLLVTLLFTLAGSLARRTVSAVGLGLFDRLLGALFGLLRGSLLGVAILMAVAAFHPNLTWTQNSRLAPYFLAGAHAVSFVVPEHFQQQITNGATQLLQQAPELFRSHTPPHHP